MKSQRERRSAFTSFALTFAVLALAGPASAQFVYVNNNTAPNQISAFRVGADGPLTPVPGAPFPTGGDGGLCFDIASVTIRGVGRRLYATNYLSGTVSGFAVNADGSLTPVPGSPFATSPNGNPVGVVASSDGRFLFVGRQFFPPGFGIDVYHIDPNGSLRLVTGSPFGVGEEAGFDVVYDGRRKNLISNTNFQFVSVFDVGRRGALTALPGSPFPTPTVNNHKMALRRPKRDCLFVAGGGDPRVSMMLVATSGALSNAPSSPQPIGELTIAAVVEPRGRYAYFGSGESNHIFGFRIGAACSLTSLPGSPFASADVAPSGLVTDKNGKFLFAVNGFTGSVSTFGIASDGTLTLVPGGTLPLQGGSQCSSGIAFVQRGARRYDDED